MNDERVSRMLSFVLRHKPDAIKLQLDPHGWADTNELISNLAAHADIKITMWDLQRIVDEDAKQRYAIDPARNKIRANQGHSIPVEVEMEKKVPPATLYHGTATKSLPLILEQGIKSMSRQYVHLSSDPMVAKEVGARHGNPVVIIINTTKMANEDFFLSANGVWLTKHVPLDAIE